MGRACGCQREIDFDHVCFVGKAQAAVTNRGAGAFLALADGDTGQANQVEAWKRGAWVEVGLHFDDVTVQADDRAGIDDGKHAISPDVFAFR